MSVGCTGGDVTYNLKLDNSQAAASISELNRLFSTYLSLARRTGLPESIVDALSRIYQLQAAIQALYRSILLLKWSANMLNQNSKSRLLTPQRPTRLETKR